MDEKLSLIVGLLFEIKNMRAIGRIRYDIFGLEAGFLKLGIWLEILFRKLNDRDWEPKKVLTVLLLRLRRKNRYLIMRTRRKGKKNE